MHHGRFVNNKAETFENKGKIQVTQIQRPSSCLNNKHTSMYPDEQGSRELSKYTRTTNDLERISQAYHPPTPEPQKPCQQPGQHVCQQSGPHILFTRPARLSPSLFSIPPQGCPSDSQPTSCSLLICPPRRATRRSHLLSFPVAAGRQSRLQKDCPGRITTSPLPAPLPHASQYVINTRRIKGRKSGWWW